MMEFRRDGLLFSFPEVHPEAKCSIAFQRTLRVPGDGRRYPVPPGLGRFPLQQIEHYGEGVPDSWERDGVFFPMYQSEALLVIFVGWYPFAIKVTVDGMNAVTGRKAGDERMWRPRDYVVFPRQPWMEWFCVGSGRARQFVAAPLEEHGSRPEARRRKEQGTIRIAAHPMRAECYREYRVRRAALLSDGGSVEGLWRGFRLGKVLVDKRAERGDHFGHGSWETSAESGCSVYPVNSLDFLRITGSTPPGKAPTRREYSEAGLPWYREYGKDTPLLEVLAHA